MWDGEGRGGTWNRNFIQICNQTLFVSNVSYTILTSTLQPQALRSPPRNWVNAVPSDKKTLILQPLISLLPLPPSLHFLHSLALPNPVFSGFHPLQKLSLIQPLMTSFQSCFRLTFLWHQTLLTFSILDETPPWNYTHTLNPTSQLSSVS